MNYEELASFTKYQWLRRKHVEALTSLSRSTIYRLMDKGKFPKSKGILAGNIVIWERKEVEEWMQEQIETVVT